MQQGFCSAGLLLRCSYTTLVVGMYPYLTYYTMYKDMAGISPPPPECEPQIALGEKLPMYVAHYRLPVCDGGRAWQQGE